MKRFLFFLMTIVAAASTYDYAKAANPYPVIIIAGVVAALYLAEKVIRQL
ncbi:hypothetical protein AB0L82_06960 [Nocardia sp. NPDC052001]